MIRYVPEARWACKSCGACCQGFRFGPVEASVIEDLTAKNIAEAWDKAAEAWYTTEVDSAGQSHFYLRRTPEGACIFLQADRRCAVHRLYGEAAKPGFCREFPFRAVQIGADTAVIVRGECAGLAETFQTGPLVADQAAAAIALPRVVPIMQYAPHLTQILPGLGVDPAAWDRLEAAMLPQLADLDPILAVQAIRKMLAQAMGRALPASAQGPQALQHLLQRLQTLAREGARAEGLLPWQQAVFSDARLVLETALRAVIEADPWPDFTENGRAYGSLLLRQFLLGREFAALGSVAAGLGRVVLEARIVQAATGGPVNALRFGKLHSRYLRFVDHAAVQQLLKSEQGALVALFLGT